MLREYEELVPGSATNLLNAHLTKEAATTDAVTRLTKAESAAVRIGTWGSVIVAIGGLMVGIALIAAQHNALGVAALIPGILAAVTALVSEIRDTRREK
jgi:hypothetical protein